MARIRTYSVYNHASRTYMHITATSKKHVKTYLREKVGIFTTIRILIC